MTSGGGHKPLRPRFQGGFAVIPRHLLGALTHQELAIYVALAANCNQRGVANLSQTNIGYAAGMNDWTVRTHLPGLIQKGVITPVRAIPGEPRQAHVGYRVRFWTVPDWGWATTQELYEDEEYTVRQEEERLTEESDPPPTS